MKARYPLQEKHSKKQELLAAMRASVETELEVARQSYALGEWSLLYLSHPDFLLADVSTLWAKHLDRPCK
jgi:hypothetical protein